MITAIIITVYLIGGVLGYILTRKAYLNEFDNWTVSDRNAHLWGISMSWIFFVFGLYIFLQSLPENNEPSKW